MTVVTDTSKFPKWDDLFMPVLQKYACNTSLHLKESIESIYKDQFSNFSLDVRISSGTPVIYDRLGWALYALYAGKFLERVSRGEYKITEKGLKRLKTKEALTYDYLITNDEDYKNSTFHLGKKSTKAVKKEGTTPQEDLDKTVEEILIPRKNELLQKCRNIDPFIFEKIVGKLCEAMGYGTFFETPKSHDGGIDGIIKGDSLGFEKIYIQAKRYAENNIVQEKEMQNFIGALASSNGVRRGIFFTTSSFSEKAIKKSQDASGQDIILIDGDALVNLMFQYNIGVQVKEIYELKDIDEDFFDSFN